MADFAILPHTADARLLARGRNLEELFRSALLGMAEILKPGSCAAGSGLPEKREILVAAPEARVLLINFLSEVLTLAQEERVIFCGVDFAEILETGLRAKIFGAKIAGFDGDIKAVTYHEAEIKRNAAGLLETVVVFDI